MTDNTEARVTEARRMIQEVAARRAPKFRRVQSAKEDRQLLEAAVTLSDHVGQCHAALTALDTRVRELEAERAAAGEASMSLGEKRGG